MSPTCESRVSYALTVTFRPEYTWKDKFDVIEKIPKFLRIALTDVVWEYSIEYHKHHIRHPFAGQDNPNAPHVHVLFSVPDTKQRKQGIPVLIDNLKRNAGNPDLRVLHTPIDIELWSNYIRKDVETNNVKIPTIQHFKTI